MLSAYFLWIPGILPPKGGDKMAGKGLRARLKMWMMEYAYLVTAGAIAAIVAASAMYANRIRTEEGIQAAADAPETAAQVRDMQAEKPAVTPLPTIAPFALQRGTINGRTVWPTGGGILRGYDAQEAVYWEMLGSYKPHAALDIRGDDGEEVLTIADGVVESAQRDEMWGWQVAVKQTDGRTMRYAGLKTAFVCEGQSVTRGQTIGVLMPYIPCEAELGAHVHVEMSMEGKTQDPEAILPEKRVHP